MSASLQVYRLNNQATALTEHQKQQLEQNLKTMMDREVVINKLKASLTKRHETVEADQTRYDELLNDLKHSADLFEPLKSVKVLA